MQQQWAFIKKNNLKIKPYVNYGQVIAVYKIEGFEVHCYNI